MDFSSGLNKCKKKSKNRNKGKSLMSPVDSFVVFDLETTGKYIGYCEIVEIAAIKVIDDEVVDTFDTLVKPCESIPASATAVHGITNSMVADSPSIKECLPLFLDFIGDSILVGHNIDTYDLNIIYDYALKLFNHELNNDFVDTYKLARKCICGIPNHRLTTIAEYYGVDNSNAHRALADCAMTLQCYLKMRPLRKFDSIKSFYFNPDGLASSDLSGKKVAVKGRLKNLSLDEFESIITKSNGIYRDAFYSNVDILVLSENIYGRYLDANASSAVIDKARKYAKSGSLTVISETTFLKMCGLKENLAPNKELSVCSLKPFELVLDITGKVICLTGEFKLGNRKELEKKLSDMGCTCKKTVVLSTDYLVIGELGSDSYKEGTRGKKYERAIELKEKNHKIQILRESEFFKCVEVFT